MSNINEDISKLLPKLDKIFFQIKARHVRMSGIFVSNLVGFCNQRGIKPWRFIDMPSPYWKANFQNQVEFFDHLGKELGLQKKEDWINITEEQVISRHGANLLAMYENSLPKALSTMYPFVPLLDNLLLKISTIGVVSLAMEEQSQDTQEILER